MRVNAPHISTLVLVIGLTVLSGLGDAEGFVHASATWMNGKIVWTEGVLSLLGFVTGAVCYLLVINFLQQSGIVSAEIQTLIWLLVAMIGVALLTGRFFHWQRLDQIIAVLILAGIGWLVAHTGG